MSIRGATPEPLRRLGLLVGALAVCATLLGGCAARGTNTRGAPHGETDRQATVSALFLQAQMTLEDLSEADRAELAAGLLERAIALEPTSAELHRYLAEAWAAKPDHERAVEAAMRAVELAPSDALAHHLAGVQLHRAGQGELAELHLREAARRGIGGDAPHQPHFDLFRLLREAGRVDDASAALDAWAAALPGDRRPATLRADLLWEAGRADEARAAAAAALLADAGSERAGEILTEYHRFDPLGEVEALETALEANWSERSLHRRLVHVYSEIGRYDRALAHLRYVGMLDARKGGELVRRRAWLLGRMDRHDEAIELLSETISATGDAATADLLALSDAFDLAGDPASALAVLERVLPADPDYQLAARRRVRIHLDRGEAGLAAEAALSARQVLPLEQVDGRAALLELAVQARVDQSSFDRAEALIGELEPLDADRAHRALGLVLTGRGLDAEAIELEEEAIVLEPSELAHRTRLARLLVDSGASEAAVATLDAAIASVEARRDALLADASPDLAWSAVEQARGTVAWLLLRRSFIEKDAGLPERSEASLRALLELYPRHGEGMNALAYLWAEEDRNLDEATELVSRAVEQRPYSGAFADTVGWILYRQGRHAEAVEQLRRALDLLPGDDPEVLDHLADALRAAGQHDEALRSWRAVLALLADLDDPSRRAGDVERIEGKIRQLEAQVEAGE